MERDWEAPRAVPRPKPKQCIPMGVRPVGAAAVAQGHILILPALLEGLPRPWAPDLPQDARSLLVLPLVSRQQILGAMLLISRRAETFGEEHTRTLTIIRDHAAAAMASERLIDQLGEFNERLLASELAAHQARAGLIISQRQRLSEELELNAGQGWAFLTLVSITPLEESGEVLAIVRDVTRRRALERQLMHAEKKLASVGILATGVAHEIGNPLSAVSGYAQLLTKDGISEAERIHRIIRDLLDYSRPSPYLGQAVEVNLAI